MGVKQFKELKISEEVSPLIEVADVTVPEAGKQVRIINGKAEIPYDINAAAKIIWDYGGDNEEILWSIRGSGEIPTVITIENSETDGVKKLAITVDNALDLSVLMSMFVKMEID